MFLPEDYKPITQAHVIRQLRIEVDQLRKKATPRTLYQSAGNLQPESLNQDGRQAALEVVIATIAAGSDEDVANTIRQIRVGRAPEDIAASARVLPLIKHSSERAARDRTVQDSDDGIDQDHIESLETQELYLDITTAGQVKSLPKRLPAKNMLEINPRTTNALRNKKTTIQKGIGPRMRDREGMSILKLQYILL